MTPRRTARRRAWQRMWTVTSTLSMTMYPMRERERARSERAEELGGVTFAGLGPATGRANPILRG
jgi:hypothetical protein